MKRNLKLLSNIQCKIALLLILIQIVINLFSASGQLSESDDTLFSIFSLIADIIILFILIKYFDNYKEKGIISLIYITIILEIIGIIGFSISLTIAKNVNEDELILFDILSFLFGIIYFFILLFLNLKIINFSKDTGNYLRKYAISNIVIIIIGSIIYISGSIMSDNNTTTNADRIISVLEIVPLIFIFLFFKKLLTLDCSYNHVNKTIIETKQNIPELIKKISELKEQGIISEEEFNQKKSELLNKL